VLEEKKEKSETGKVLEELMPENSPNVERINKTQNIHIQKLKKSQREKLK
jgi:hypothetical protein